MKRISLYPFALSALLCLAGCADEDSFGPSSVRGDNSLLAVIEGQETDVVSRTAVDDAGRVTWIATDALGVYAAHTENALFSSTGSGASVVFKGNLSPADDAAEWAYYPYDANAVVNGQTLSFTLPDEYTYTGNSHAPMLAVKGSEGNFEFKHLCGLLRITLGGGMPADADRFVITSVGDDAPALSGLATVSDVMATDATLALPKEGGHTITYTLGALSSAEELQHFFVPLPVGNYPKLKVAFYLKDKSEPEFTRTLSGLQVRRAVMTSMPILDWRTGEQFVLNENTIEITDALAKHVSVSPEDNTTLVYKATATDDVPSVGNVVWSRVSDDFPYGFLGKVTKVTANGDGSYTVETGVASLSEAFDELCIEETVELTPTDSRYLQSRALNFKDIENEKFSPNISLEIEKGQENGPLFVSGTIEAGAELTVSIYFVKNIVDLVNLQLETCVSIEGKAGAKFSVEKTKEFVNQQLGSIALPNVPLAAGIIQISPTMTPYFFVKGEGEITNTLDFSTKIKNGFYAQRNYGKWTCRTKEIPAASGDAPWHIGSLSFKGQLSLGISNEFSLKLYGRDDMKLFVEPEIGAKLSGELSINETNSQSLDQILRDVELESCLYVGGEIGIDASLILPDDVETKLTFDLFEFCEINIPLFRSMADMLANLNEEEEDIKVDIYTEAAGPQLINEAQMVIALEDGTGEVIETSEPVDCSAIIEEQIIEDPIPIATSFKGLKRDVEYTSYPIIQSPVLEEIVPEGKLNLRFMDVTFKASGSLRDQLIQMYKDTGGDNWTNNENWCTNEPIENWYGVYSNGQGKYEIVLPENNLTGNFSLSNSDIIGLELRNNSLTAINVSDCTDLVHFGYSENPLTLLDISNCNSLQEFNLNEWEQLKTFRARQNSKVTRLNFYDSPLEVLDLNGCENLTNCSLPNEKTLRSVNLGGCKALQNNPLHFIWEHPIEFLDISGLSYPDMTAISLPETIGELYVNDCTSLQLITNAVSTGGGGNIPSNLRILEARNTTSMEQIYCVNNQLMLLDVRGSSVESIYCDNDNADMKQNDMILNVSGCSNLDILTCHNCHLNELDLTGCTGLTQLSCSGNELRHLNLTDNYNLISLGVSNNQLSDIDLSPCYALESFDCGGNPMSSLDVSGNRNLKSLSCGGTGLNPNLNFTSLTLNNPALEDFYCSNSGLTSLDLSNYKYLKRVQCTYNLLKSLNLNGCTLLEDVTCFENQITEFNIDQCYALKTLDCCYNQLEDLDISGRNVLTDLRCGSNQLKSLNIDGCNLLATLICDNNFLLSIDVTNFTELDVLAYSGNGIKALDATGCISLETIYGDANPTKRLILNGCQSLKRVDFRETPLEVLGLAGCIGLTDIFLRNVQLTSLDISGCSSLQTLDCAENMSLTTLILPDGGLPNLNRMAVQGTRITQEIPNWLTLKSGNYEQRYTDYNVTYVLGEKQVTYTDKGYGWWYPGEPESGAHRR